MRLMRHWCAGFLALFAWGLGVAAAPAQKAPAETEIKATYRVALAALSLGEFDLNASINGSSYEVEAKGEFSLLAGMLYRASGRTTSKGKLSKSGPQPAKFMVNFDSGKKKERRELRFSGGAVQDVSIVPRKKRRPDRYVEVTDAQLRNVLNRGNTGSTVWADTAYRSKTNEAWLEKNGYVSDIHHKKPKGRPMSEAASRANSRRSKIRAFVEHVFAQQKSRMGLFVRTIGIDRARTKIGMANLAYNLTRFVWHQRRTAPA